MKYNPMSRRMFLTGAGQTCLSIPLLTSLLPREARAAASQGARPLRFVMMTNHGSPSERGFFGQYYANAETLGLQKAPGNVLTTSVSYRSLAEMTGDLSYILSPLSSLKDRVTVIRGLDSMALENGAHPSGFASAASGYGLSRSTHSGQFSMDLLIAQKIAPKGVPSDRLKMTLHPNYSGQVSTRGYWSEQNELISGTFGLSPSYNGIDKTRTFLVRSMTNSAQILAKFFSSASGTAEVINRRGLINSIFPQYQRVRDLKNISTDDRHTLDAFISYISDVEAGIDFEASGLSCQAPALENDFPPPVLIRLANESDAAYVARSIAALQKWRTEQKPLASPILWRNHSKLVAAAFACDLTRVASFAMGQVGSHVFHHSAAIPSATPTSSVDAKAYFDAQKSMASGVAGLMTTLAGFPDAGGTLLDNTLIYWNQNYGCVGGGSGAHSRKNFPVVLAGGSQGKLKLGYYIDYRFQMGGEVRGLPLNNLLVSIMNCYGVTAADYEFKANTGYGSYDGYGKSMPSNTVDLTGKRALLPFLAA